MTTAALPEKPRLVTPAVAKDCLPATPVSAPVGSVDALLKEARKTAKSKSEKPVAAQPPACHAARLEAQLIETGALLPAAAKSASATLDPNVIVEFDSENAGVSDKDRKAVATTIAAQAKAGRRQVRIYAGRGGDGNIFERAAIADRRAKLVRGCFPPLW